MERLYELILGENGIERAINSFIWGAPAMILIMGVGLYVGIRNGFPQFTHFIHIMKNTLGKALKKTEKKAGAVSPFKAMCTALAASIGTGNIAGVSGAIALGGPGAVFWMWLSALLACAPSTVRSPCLSSTVSGTRPATGWAVPCTTSATAWARSGPGWR